jgi:uncharacterized protein with PIN domain
MSEEASLFIRLYLDEDIHRRLAAALRLRNFDVTSVHEVKHFGFTDEEQLLYATAEKRTLVSYNTGDYLKLHKEWLARDQEHCGIIVSDQLPIGETIRRLLKLLNHVTADEIYNQLYWLQLFK